MMKTNKISFTHNKNVKLKSYKQFVDVIENSKDSQREVKMKQVADYIEYIKVHDKEAYKNYLSYSTYLRTCV